MAEKMVKCRPVQAGLSVGIVWGAVVLLMALAAAYFNYGDLIVALLMSMYPGYDETIGGAVVGGILGFIDSFIVAYLVVVIYNKLNK